MKKLYCKMKRDNEEGTQYLAMILRGRHRRKQMEAASIKFNLANMTVREAVTT